MTGLPDPGGTRASFPFAAVVGADDAKLALLLNAVEPRIGGVLLRGDKGSAKSTLARGVADLLPGDAPFVELPVGATEDRVVGTIDVASALSTGEPRFAPGLLAAADGGVLYVDEVNLLPDHLVDVLLDVAASGVNRVEREGISRQHRSQFVLVGSMNPEEGELRPQLLDRFGLAVDVAAAADAATRAVAVRRRLAHDADPGRHAEQWAAARAELVARLAGARPAEIPDEVLQVVAMLCVSTGVEGLRADLAICRAASALAGWEGRPAATTDDVRRVAPFALAHRRRRGPFDEHGVDREEIDAALARASGSSAGDDPSPAGSRRSDGGRGPGAAAGATGEESPTTPADGGMPGDSGKPASGTPGDRWRSGDVPTASGEPAVGTPSDRGRSPAAQGADQPVAPLGTPTPVAAVRASWTDELDQPSGRRSPAQGRRGRRIGVRVPDGPVASVDLGATVRAAAQRRAGRAAEPALHASDLREPVREQQVGNLVILAVDASASMGADARMQAVKGAVLGLLVDAYQRRDRVSLVAFRGTAATVLLRPTGSVEVARARLSELPTGGRTPLAAGIECSLAVAAQHRQGHRPLLVLVSDGRATAGPDGVDPVEAALAAAAEVRRRSVPALVVNVESGPVRLGLAASLADAMGADHLTLAELSAEAIASTVREVVAR